jgi:hypothetical protein
MNLKALRQRAADLKADIAKQSKAKAMIGETAVAEKRAMTDKERADFLALTPVIEGLQAQLAENDLLLQAAEASNEADRVAAAGRVADPDATTATAAARGAGLVVGESAEDKLKSPSFLGHALHAVRRIALREEQADDRKLVKHHGRSDGREFGRAVRRRLPDRARPVEHASSSAATTPARSRSLVTRQPVSGNALNLPAVDETSRANGSRFGGISSTWIGQGTTVTAGKPKFRLMELKLKKLLAFVYGTDELVADAVASAPSSTATCRSSSTSRPKTPSSTATGRTSRRAS